MIETAARAEMKRLNLERGIVTRHGRYPHGKIPVRASIEPKSVHFDECVVTYHDGSERAFEVLAPDFVGRIDGSVPR